MNVKNNYNKSYIMLISSMLIVGTIGIFRRFIPLSSALLAFFRGVIGAAFLGAFLILKNRAGRQRIAGKKLVGLILNGAFIGINWILLFEAYNYTTVAKATLCYYMEPTIVLLLSPLVFKERLSLKKGICALTALVGMVLISGVIGMENFQGHDMRGVLLALGAACFYALVVIINKKIGEFDAYEKTTIQLFSAAIALLPYLLITGSFLNIQFDFKMIVLLLIVGILHTGIAYVLYFGSMSGLKAQTISALSYIDPVVAFAVSTLILREPITVAAVMGAVLIIGAALVGEKG